MPPGLLRRRPTRARSADGFGRKQAGRPRILPRGTHPLRQRRVTGPGPTMGVCREIVAGGLGERLSRCPLMAARCLTAARPSPRIDGVEPVASRGSTGAHGPPQTFRGWTLGLALLAAAWAACASPPEAVHPLYRWTDEAGVVRYTPDRARIPRGARRDAEAVQAVRSVESATSVESVEPVKSVEWGATPTVDAPSDPPHPSTPPAGPPSQLDARIRALEEMIARDEQALKAMISAEAGTGGSLAESAELREIARRLPGLQANLRALRERRATP